VSQNKTNKLESFFHRRESVRDSVEKFSYVNHWSRARINSLCILLANVWPLFVAIAREIIMHQISCGLSCHRDTSTTHRRCLRSHRLRDTHIQKYTHRGTRKTTSTLTTDIPPWKNSPLYAPDLLIDRGFDLARSYRFRVVALWWVILSPVHNRLATIFRRSKMPNYLIKSMTSINRNWKKSCAIKFS